jgi:hypothetical protein
MAVKVPTWIGVLIILSPVTVGGLISGCGDGGGGAKPSETCSSSKCVVRAPTGGEDVVLAVSKQSLTEMMNSGSDRAIAVMVLNGSAFLVAQNTSVSIVDRGFQVRKVLVLEGPMMGRTGWTLQDWVVDRK